MLQKLVPYCLGKTSDLTVYDRNRSILLRELSSYGFTLVKPEGAFYLFMRSPIESAKEFCEAAKKHEILIVPSESFGCPGYVRISYCVSTEEITRALPAFKNLAKDFGLC
jgi:aspartate aminotransferase